MAAGNAAVPANPTSHHVASLLPKLRDADPDIRFMSLADMEKLLVTGHAGFLQHDYQTCARAVDGLLHTLNDSNGEVQNMSIKCLGPFVNRAPESILCPLFDKVSNLRTDNTVDSSVPALAVRAIVVALPRPVQGVPRTKSVEDAYSAVSRALVPRLVGYTVMPIQGQKNLPPPPKGMIEVELEKGTDSNALDVLREVALCFGPMLQDAEVHALQKTTMEVLESPKCGTVVKKKAVSALSALSPYFSDALLSQVVSHTIELLRNSHLMPAQRRLYLNIYASMAKSIPRKFGPYLKTLAPFVLAPLSEQELEQQQEDLAESDEARDPQVEEVREIALVALDAFMASCSQDMESYLPETIDSALRFLKYDPNYAVDDGDDDDDMDEAEEGDDDFELDEDFEEETGFDDEDDVSWKVRKSAAKLLQTIIATKASSDLASMYDRIAPALIARFQEREESVRTAVISALAFLVRKTGDHVPTTTRTLRRGSSTTGSPPLSRKRRRGSSDAGLTHARPQLALSNGYASPVTPPPQSGPQLSLTRINPDIVKGASKLLKTSSVETKHATITLLADMVNAQHGGLSDRVDLVVDPVLDAVKFAAASNAVTSNALRVETLKLLRVIAETHSSKILEPYLGKIIPALVSVSKDKFSKVAREAFDTIEVYIKALTPPRSAGSKAQNAVFLQQLYEVIIERISASDTDTEVRQTAILALGLLVGRTSGSQGASLLTQDKRAAALQLIGERMKNELTRLASVRAVDTVAYLAQSKKEFQAEWVRSIALELGAQLRKASRSLRGASLTALRRLSGNAACRENLDDDTVVQVVQGLLPLILVEKDLHMIGPALHIIGAFANDRPQLVLDAEVIKTYCFVAKMDLGGAALEALLDSLDIVGKKGAGKDLMKALLADVGVSGNPELVGQVIGTLLVAGGDSVGVTLNDFTTELQSAPDDRRKCLALYILGEAGLRMGANFPLGPETFTAYFATESEKVPLAAAVALGRAAAGNVNKYLPQILATMGQGRQYLLLHSVKELLQHGNAEADMIQYSKTLWDDIITASQLEDNKVVGAECIGRLATIDPAAYLPQLQTYLSDPTASVRGMVTSALRYTFSETDPTYDTHLAPSIAPMLTTMLNDTDVHNRRLALTTFNSAIHNKPELVLPHFETLLPLVMKETLPRPELIREVTMGPFKHKVDDGLELRKSAYETLYALMETSFGRVPIDDFYNRMIAGVGDEHEIKILCCLMLTKLVHLAPEASVRRLDDLATAFRAVLAFRPKDNAVKQELEKISEHNKAICKVAIAINKAFPTETSAENCRQWADFWTFCVRERAVDVKRAEDDERGAERDR